MKLARFLTLIIYIVATSIFLLGCTPKEKPKYNNQTLNFDEISVQILPLFPASSGKRLLIEPLEIANREELINNVRSAIKDIGNHLKPLPIPSFTIALVPASIGIEEYIQADLGHIDAWFDSDYKTLAITCRTYQIAGIDDMKGKFSHELGHLVWNYVLTQSDKLEYFCIAGGLTQQDRELAKKYSRTEEQLYEEWFAEEFRLYAIGLPNIEGFKSRLGLSHAEPTELQKFYHKFTTS